MTEIRLVTGADVPGLHRVPMEAFNELDRQHNRPAHEWDERRIGWWERRCRHLLETDPGLQWLAIDGDRVVGTSSGTMRDGLWGLSLLVVRPGLQGVGLGRRLIAKALDGWTGRGIICASDDPRALHRYGAEGFALSPIYTATGNPDLSAHVADPHVRDGVDRDFADDVDRAVRGSGHGPDHDFLLANGSGLRYEDGARRGYVYLGWGGRVQMAAATDPGAASALLWAALARGADSGEEVSVSQVTGHQQWAVRILVDARLSLATDGSLCYRGMAEPDAYIPSGVFL